MSWLNEILIQHAEYESPKSFWYWSALASISAVLKDSIWFDKYLYKVYPNIYVMLHADSGLKKGPPVSMAKQLVRHVNNTRIISGRASIQGILKKLGTTETKPGGLIIPNSVAFICSSELSSSIVEDKAATTILTDLYDRNYNIGEWESLLKMEAFQLKDTTVTMLTATNEALGEEFFMRKDVHGGYFARTFIIYEHEGQTVNSLMFKPEHMFDYQKSAKYLRVLAELKGEMKMENETRKYFDDWYKKFRKNISDQRIKDPTGTLNRFDDSILKTAMLISLGHEPIMTISNDAVIQAIGQCEKLVGNVRQAMVGAGGRSDTVHQQALAIKELLARDTHMISRTQLNKKYWMHGRSELWDQIMISLQDAGTITIEPMGNQIIYRMTDVAVEQWTNHFKGK